MRKARVAVFGSLYGGFFLLKEILEGSLSNRLELVGVATDDPSKEYVHASRRIWKYSPDERETSLVSTIAAEHGYSAYTESIKTDAFHDLFRQSWRPDLCLMATFGQLIDPIVIGFPSLGFFNFHHSFDDSWPSYPGPDPIAAMVKDRRPYVVISMHGVTEILDNGPLVARSPRTPLVASDNALTVHRRTWVKAIGPLSVVIGAILPDAFFNLAA